MKVIKSFSENNESFTSKETEFEELKGVDIDFNKFSDYFEEDDNYEKPYIPKKKIRQLKNQ
jgi:hypothetical protein